MRWTSDDKLGKNLCVYVIKWHIIGQMHSAHTSLSGLNLFGGLVSMYGVLYCRFSRDWSSCRSEKACEWARSKFPARRAVCAYV